LGIVIIYRKSKTPSQITWGKINLSFMFLFINEEERCKLSVTADKKKANKMQRTKIKARRKNTQQYV